MSWVKRLLDPAPQIWKNVLWEMLEGVYGGYCLGPRLIVSATTLGDLPGASGMPDLFVRALQAWARLPTPQLAPLDAPTFEEVSSQPLIMNPANGYPGFAPRRAASVPVLRTRDGEALRERDRVARLLASENLTHVQCVLTAHLLLHPGPQSCCS